MGGLHALQWPRGHEGDGASLPALDLRDLAHELRIAVHRADDGRGRGAKWEVPGGWVWLQARGELEGHRRDRLHDRGPEGAADRGLEILEQGAKVDGVSTTSERARAHSRSEGLARWHLHSMRIVQNVQNFARVPVQSITIRIGGGARRSPSLRPLSRRPYSATRQDQDARVWRPRPGFSPWIHRILGAQHDHLCMQQHG